MLRVHCQSSFFLFLLLTHSESGDKRCKHEEGVPLSNFINFLVVLHWNEFALFATSGTNGFIFEKLNKHVEFSSEFKVNGTNPLFLRSA